jgi:hypothetical protein
MNLLCTHREHSLTIKNTNHLLMLEEIMTVYCENHRGQINAVYVESVQSF